MLTLAFLFLLLAVALLAYAELSLPTELPIMRYSIQPSPQFSGAFILCGGDTPIPCANFSSAKDTLRSLTQPAPQAIDEPSVKKGQQTSSITANRSGNFTVTIRNLDGTIADQYDCRNWATAEYLTRDYR